MPIHSHKTIPSLDGLRAVSIAIVFFAHAGVSNLLPGGFGVTVFFFLSGYLITTLFHREADKSGTVNLRSFYIRRIMRLSPPLFFTLGLTYLLVAAGVFRGQLAPGAMASQFLYYYNYYVVFVPNAVEGALGVNVLWSLAVEEHFYMIYPWLFLLMLRNRIGLNHMTALLIAFLLWRVIRVLFMGATADEIYMSTDTRFDAILFGCYLAMLQNRGITERLFPQGILGQLVVLGVAGAVLLFTFVYREDLFRQTLRYTLQSLALMPLFYYAVTRPQMVYFAPLQWLPIRWIGVYSYTIYLCHTVIMGNLHFSGLGPDNRYVFAVVSFALCTAYAAALYHFVELPFKAWWQRRAKAVLA